MLKKVSDLEGPALDWAVAKCEGGFDLGQRRDWHNKPWFFFFRDDEDPERVDRVYLNEYEPSTDWAIGGPLVEREGLWVREYAVASPSVAHPITPDKKWFAYAKSYPTGSRNHCLYGETYLIAAMRCYVASKFGDEVEIPEELC